MARLGPAIHVFAADRSARCECVDARHKAGHDELAGRCIIRMSQNTSGRIEPLGSPIGRSRQYLVPPRGNVTLDIERYNT
jgi:hypothetical protein